MPQKLEGLITNLDQIPEEGCKHLALNCIRTIISQDVNLTVNITCLKWTFNYEFCLRVTAYALGAPNVSKQMDIDDYHSPLRSLTDALNLYEAFLEPHLTSHQLEFLEELIEYLHLKSYWSILAQPHLASTDMALDKFSGTDPDQDAEAFNPLKQCQNNFALGTEPDHADAEHVMYLFRKEALFSSLIRGAATEWYLGTNLDAKTWNEVRTVFITKCSDGRNKLRHRMEVEHCIRAVGEKIRNFLHRKKKTVDKSWPDHVVGITAADQNTESIAQFRQRRQRYFDYTLGGFRPRHLQRKAQNYLMEHQNAIWNDISTHLFNKDVSYQVSTSFLNDEEQNKAQMASLGQKL